MVSGSGRLNLDPQARLIIYGRDRRHSHLENTGTKDENPPQGEDNRHGQVVLHRVAEVRYGNNLIKQKRRGK